MWTEEKKKNPTGSTQPKDLVRDDECASRKKVLPEVCEFTFLLHAFVLHTLTVFHLLCLQLHLFQFGHLSVMVFRPQNIIQLHLKLAIWWK